MAEAVSSGLGRVERPANPWATWTIVVVGVVLVGLALAFFARTMAIGSDGAHISQRADSWNENGVLIEPVELGPGGLLPGDRVLAVDGVGVEMIGSRLLAVPPASRDWAPGQTVTYTVFRDGEALDVEITLGGYPLAAVLKGAWATVAVSVMILLIASIAFALRPSSPAARAFVLIGIGAFGSMPWGIGLGIGDFVDGLSFWLYFIPTVIGYPLVMIAFLHFWLVLPQAPRQVSSRPWLIPALYVAPVVAEGIGLAFSLLSGGDLRALLAGPVAIVSYVIVLLYVTAGLVVAAWRFKTTVDPVGRRQVRLVVLALGVPLAASLVLGLIPEAILGAPLLSYHFQALLALPAPVVIAIAVLRYRLFDVDAIISRAVVYTLLSGAIVGVYVLLVGGVGAVVQDDNNIVVSLIAIGLAAVLFQPLRQRLQRGVNRMLYGAAAEPYEVLSQLGRRLEETLAPEQLLGGVVETVADSLDTAYVGVELKGDHGFFVAAERGEKPSTAMELSMVYQGDVVGRLVAAPRASGGPFSMADERLLADIARQAGPVAQSVRVTAELQRSREHLVAAREEERRRLRRDLHDGVGPTLASIAMRLDAARHLVSEDSDQAEAALDGLTRQTQEAIAEIRRLAYELRPPALDELGLAGALEEYAARVNGAAINGTGTQVTVDVTGLPAQLPAAAEVAIYRIAVEAVVNTLKHAHAEQCHVRLSGADSAVWVEVVDDGVGLSAQTTSGVGMSAMRERAAELGGTCTVEPTEGGGTRVLARLPLRASASGA